MQPRKLVRDQKNIQILEARSSKFVWNNLGTHSFSPQPNLKISTIFQNFQELCKNMCNSSKIWKKKKCSRASLNETRHYNLNIFCSILHDLDHYAHVLIMSQLNGDCSELMQFDLSQFRLQFWSAHVRQHTHWRLDKARSYDTHVLSAPCARADCGE